MNRLPSLVPVLTGALAASAGALLLLGWHGRPLAGAFVIATAALGIVPLVLLFRMAAAGASPRPAPAPALALYHEAYTGGLNDADLAAVVDVWAGSDERGRSRSWRSSDLRPAPVPSGRSAA